MSATQIVVGKDALIGKRKNIENNKSVHRNSYSTYGIIYNVKQFTKRYNIFIGHHNRKRAECICSLFVCRNEERGSKMALTAKQEKFIQGIVTGLSQREAYKAAYDVKSMSDNAIDREACLLMKNPKIAQRHKELVDEIAIPAIMTAQERLEYLTRLIKEEETERVLTIGGEFIERKADFNAKLKAIDLMNKMQGEYVQKIEADVNSEVNISIELVED